MRVRSLLAATALCLASCSGPSESEQEATSLADFLDYESEEQQRNWQESRWAATEELVQSCMASEGFDYFPEPFEFVPTPSAEQLRDRDYVAERGYGLVTGLASDDLRPSEPSNNERILESLPTSEQPIYVQLIGQCQEVAFLEINSVWLEPKEAVQNAQSELWERVDTDPRILDIESRWVDCVAAEGYEATSQDSFAEDIFRAISDAEMDGSIDDEELSELASLDRELALVDFDCRAPMEEERLAVVQEYEAELIETHLAELIAIQQEIRQTQYEG